MCPLTQSVKLPLGILLFSVRKPIITCSVLKSLLNFAYDETKYWCLLTNSYHQLFSPRSLNIWSKLSNIHSSFSVVIVMPDPLELHFFPPPWSHSHKNNTRLLNNCQWNTMFLEPEGIVMACTWGANWAMLTSQTVTLGFRLNCNFIQLTFLCNQPWQDFDFTCNFSCSPLPDVFSESQRPHETKPWLHAQQLKHMRD